MHTLNVSPIQKSEGKLELYELISAAIQSEAFRNIGYNLTASFIHEKLKEIVAKLGAKPSPEKIAQELCKEVPSLSLEQAKVIAESTVTFMANGGNIRITQTHISTKEQAVYGTDASGMLSIGNGSTSSAGKSRIEFGAQGTMVIQNGGSMVQNTDGSVSFMVQRDST